MKLKVAQIGVGYWGPNLLRNLHSNNQVIVKTVVELSKNRRDYVNENYPYIETHDNFDVVLNDESIEAVIISTPVATHYNLAIKALERGKHILVEKPMATKVKEIEDITEIAEKNNLVAMAGHTFLFNPAVKKIKSIIDSGEIGEIRYIYSQRLNLGRIRNDVDALWNLAPHDISIIQYWLDDIEPVKIESSGMDYIQKNINDVAFMKIRYPNKVIAHIHVSWLDPNKIRKMTIVGSRKMIVYDDISQDKVVIFDKGIDKKAMMGEKMDYDEANIFNFHHRAGDITIPLVDWEEPLKLELNHFFDCIKGSINCISGPKHAKKVVRILSSGD